MGKIIVAVVALVVLGGCQTITATPDMIKKAEKRFGNLSSIALYKTLIDEPLFMYEEAVVRKILKERNDD